MTNFRDSTSSSILDVYVNEPRRPLCVTAAYEYIAKFDGNQPGDPNNGSMLVYNEDSYNWQIPQPPDSTTASNSNDWANPNLHQSSPRALRARHEGRSAVQKTERQI